MATRKKPTKMTGRGTPQKDSRTGWSRRGMKVLLHQSGMQLGRGSLEFFVELNNSVLFTAMGLAKGRGVKRIDASMLEEAAKKVTYGIVGPQKTLPQEKPKIESSLIADIRRAEAKIAASEEESRRQRAIEEQNKPRIKLFGDDED